MLSFLCLTFSPNSSICLEDQVGDLLPQLQQLQEGLQLYGLLDSLRQYPDIWEDLFVVGKGTEVTANSLLENFEVLHSDQQMKRNAEADTYTYFCDFIHSVYLNGKENLNPQARIYYNYPSYYIIYCIQLIDIFV